MGNRAELFDEQSVTDAGASDTSAGQGDDGRDVAEHSPGETARAAIAAGKSIVFFDGVCGMCNAAVDFIIARDRNGRFLYAPLQGETAAELLDSDDTENLRSMVVMEEQGTYRRSAGAVRILRGLRGLWSLCGSLLWVIPGPLRDLGYRMVATVRYRLFGKKSSCRMPSPEEAARFLP